VIYFTMLCQGCQGRFCPFARLGGGFERRSASFCFCGGFASRLRHFAVSIDKITGIRLANGVNAVLSQVKSKRLHAAKHE
jgi:hypothetical protein